jgi:hypothetical protein
VLVGSLHHLGCDWEECPRCAGQLLSCGCHDDGDDDNDWDEEWERDPEW